MSFMKTWKPGEGGRVMSIFKTRNINLSFGSCSGAVCSVSCDLKTGLEEVQEQYLRQVSKHV